jgi:tetratricopeptide (TPR) repeat protein
MHRHLRTILILLLVSLFARDAYAKPTAKEYLKRGNIQLSQNKLAEAIADFTKAIELDPAFAEAYVRRGIAQRAKGRLNEAIQDFEKAESIDPGASVSKRLGDNNRLIAEAYSNRGFIELNDLQVDRAVSDLTKAIRYHGEPTHYQRRGLAHLLEENLELAIEDFNVALSLSTYNQFLTSLIYMHRGYALLLQGKERAAEEDFEKSMKIQNVHKIMIEIQLKGLESQIKQMRQRRREMLKEVA